MVAATLPGETQTRPENFGNVEQRQQVIIFQHLVCGVQIHQMQLVGRFDQLLLGTLCNCEILVRILIDHVTVRHHIGFLQRILFVQPLTVELPLIFESCRANLQRIIGDLRLRQAVFGIVGLDHPAQNGGVVKGVFQGIAAIFHHHLQLTRPLLPGRKRGVNDVLLGNANFVIQQLSDNRDVSGVFKLTAFLPDEQRPGDRRAG